MRDERAKLLRAVRVMKAEDVPKYAVSGQYGPAKVGGQDLPGFREEKSVDPDAQTDTYAAVTFYIDNWRWGGRTVFTSGRAKRMPKRVTEYCNSVSTLRHSAYLRKKRAPVCCARLGRICWSSGFSRKKVFRYASFQRARAAAMRGGVRCRWTFNYGSSFGERTPTAYETLLVDAMVGDATLYTRQDMVDASWQIVQPVLDVWARTKFDFPNYASGSWGPKEADEMLARQGHVWRVP